MREHGLRHTTRLTSDGIKRIKTAGASDELAMKIGARDENPESAESNFEIAMEYLTDNFARQADGLRALRAINDPDARKQRALALMLRRKEVLNSLQEALRSHSLTDLEVDQLRWTYDMGCTFVNQISKTLNLFNTQYGMDSQRGAVLAYLTTTEMQQNLAEMMITHRREASDAPSPAAKESRLYIEEVLFPLFNTMAVRSMGLAEGSRLYTIVENGVYATAAAYHVYSDPSLNRFGKSFRVVVPSPYMDAFEQTDLLLIDEEGMTAEVRAEIRNALDLIYADTKRNALDDLGNAAKDHIYKVQVKSRSNGPKELTEEEKVERDRFASARCTSKGFDNYDFLVLNSTQARSIVQNERG